MGNSAPPEACRCLRTSSRGARQDEQVCAPGDVTLPTVIAGIAAGRLGTATPELPTTSGGKFRLRSTRWQSLATLRQPSGSLYRLYTETASEADATPTAIATDPIASRSAERRWTSASRLTSRSTRRSGARAETVACYAGRQDVCRALGIAARDAGRAIELPRSREAMVRGAIAVSCGDWTHRALAGALSPSRVRIRRTGRGKGKTAPPYTPRYRPDAAPAAVFHDACRVR